MSLGPADLVLCAATLASTPLVERIPIAAEAGYAGVSLFPTDVEHARADGHSDADLRARLDDHGLQVADLDPFMAWPVGVEPSGQGFDIWSEQDFYDAAEALGARSINAVLFAPQPIEHERLVEGFAGLAKRASKRGLLVHLEFMPFSGVPDLASALAIVEEAGDPNGGVMLDVWHHFRGGGEAGAIEPHASRVFGVQLDDAPAQAEKNLIDETLHRRLLPGEGDADVVGVIRALDAGGSRAPLGVEVFSDELSAALSPLEFAKRCAAATRAVLAEARR